MEKYAGHGNIADIHHVPLLGGLWGRPAFRKIIAYFADDGASQFYRDFSDKAGYIDSLVLDGIGGHFSVGSAVLWGSPLSADVPSGKIETKELAMGLAGDDLWAFPAAGKSFCGLSPAVGGAAVVFAGLSGDPAADPIFSGEKEGRKRGCVKETFCCSFYYPCF